MKFACLIYDDEKRMEALSQDEVKAILVEYFAFTESLRASGHYLASQQLQPVTTGATVRIRKGRQTTIDGPFAETKEQLGGFYLIEAQDLSEAVELAAKIPSARFGSVEVRPIVERKPS